MEAGRTMSGRGRLTSLGEHPWRAVALAPLAMPVAYSAIFEVANPGRQPLLAFLMLAAIGSVISYGGTVFLLLPCLILVSRFTTLRAGVAGVVGAALGIVIYVPTAWMEWKSSGPDSGPPEGTFAGYLGRQLSDVEIWAFAVAGLVTAILYWLLARPSARGRTGP